MKKTTIKQNNKFILVILLSIILINSFLWALKKDSFFIDEVYTFGLANNSFGPFLEAGESSAPLSEYMYTKFYGENICSTVQNIKNILYDIQQNGIRGSEIFKAYKNDIYAEYTTKWFDKQDLLNYVAVQEDRRFDLLSVYYNQYRDVHPPLYYFLVNILSSLFPNMIPNIVCSIINLFFLFCICILLYNFTVKYFYDIKLGYLVLLYFGISMGTISMTLYMRMYAMLAFFVLANMWYHMLLIENGFIITKKVAWGIGLTTIAGFCTQYFFIIYLFFTACTMIGVLLKEKKIKETGKYFIVLFGAGISCIILWPISLKHILFGSKGAEAAENLVKSNYIKNLVDYFDIITKGFFVNIFFLIIFVIALLLGIIYRWKQKELRIGNKIQWYKILLISVPLLGYLLIITRIAEIQSDRYIMCCYPLLAFTIIGIIYKAIIKIGNKKTIKYIYMAVVGIIIAAFCFGTPNYLYTKNDEDIAFDDRLRGQRCIYIYSVWNTYTVFVPEFIQRDNSVLLVNEDDIDVLETDLLEPMDKFVLYISDTVDKDKVINQLYSIFGPDSLEYLRSEVSYGVDKDELFETEIYEIDMLTKGK